MPSTDPALQTFDDADLDSLLALWRECGLEHDGADPAGDVRRVRETGHGTILVAREGVAVVGSVMVGHDGHRGWLYYVAVTARLRRSGLGTTLVRAAEAWLAGEGIPKMLLLVRDPNPGAVAFYERLGYVVSPRIVMGRRL